MAHSTQWVRRVPDYDVEYRVVHGYRRAFVRAGSGPALLLIHGIGNDLSVWNDVIVELSQDHTVIAPDLLGHGQSDKPKADYSIGAYANAMRDLLSVLEIERATVVGHSLGGGVATQFAYQFPERCERLVLVSTGGVTREVNALLRLATMPGAHSIMSIFNAPGVQAALAGALAAMAYGNRDLALDRRVMVQLLGGLRDTSSRRAFVRTLRAAVDLRGQVVTMLDRCYLTAGMPTLLVWGERDAVIPVEHGRIAHAAMPGSRLEIFEEAGHFPHHSDPKRFLGVLRHFLETTSPNSFSARKWRALLRAGRPAFQVPDTTSDLSDRERLRVPQAAAAALASGPAAC